MRWYFKIALLNIVSVVTLAAAPQTIWLTAFVHGTVGIRPTLTFSTFIDLIKDDIEHTAYKKIVTIIRDNPFFSQAQPMQELGLKEINPQQEMAGAASALAARVFDELITKKPDTAYHYYTFGWSGLLSPSERYKDAEKLYKALQKEVLRLQQDAPHAEIKIRLISFSHGGSVCLNLAAVRQEHYPEDTLLHIDELIMLGIPIQFDTEHLVNDPIFIKIYHIYSRADAVQKLDCFSLKRFFSKRRFHTKCSAKLPNKLVQIELKIKINRPSSRKFRINRSPKHTEFWFFGWTPTSFRAYFPLYPLPVSVFTGALIEMINCTIPKIECDAASHLIIELRPTAGTAIVRERHKRKRYYASWICPAKLEQLKEIAKPYVPDALTKQAHDEHTSSAVHSITTQLPINNSQYCLCGVHTYMLPES